LLSTSTIDNVRDLPIEQVIGNFVQLKRSGPNAYKACCPLHNENTPSFVVTPSKNIFKCFGCGAGGDAIEFVMLHENLPFIEAVKKIAQDHGIPIEETETVGKTPEQVKDEELMLKWMQRAQQKYREAFVQRPSVVRYLQGRGLTRATLIEWQFGVVPDWQVITSDLINAGHFRIGEAAGLVKSGNGRMWDYFHHRLTIPIHNTQGQLIGFGGRVLPESIQLGISPPASGGVAEGRGGGAKYLNPPENPLYEKSKLLFGLHKARKHFKAHGMAVLVEGYLDVIKMHQHGWNNTVATCGTALTEAQAKHLKRFTDTVLILRDGDKAGLNALKKDIPTLLAQQFTVYVCELPAGEDPDTLFTPNGFSPCDYILKVTSVLKNYQDGVDYICAQHLADAHLSASHMAEAIQKCVELLALITNMVRREQHIKNIIASNKKLKFKPTDFTKPIAQLLQQREDERKAAQQQPDEFETVPKWVDRKRMEIDGFVQLYQDTAGYKAGIYFMNAKTRQLYRVTNFTIKPLYHIYDQANNRRLVEVDNTHRNAVVELSNQANVNQGSFEVELINKGNFMCYEYMARSEFKRIVAWLLSSMPIAYELKTLGWQPEGFFAYSNAVHYNGNLVQYDDLGMVQIEDKYYMSLGNSKIHRDERTTDNPYENDLYLKYMPAPSSGITNFQTWAQYFFNAYGAHAPFGIAFTFLTLFKDVVTQVTKMPMLYCYGQKGSGKSAMAESIMWLFFSGKNPEGNLIQATNLNPGQTTFFSFWNRLERFRNCPTLMNEFDENVIEPWKTGAFKASYDGEGREVGEGTTGKKRKTAIQKVQGTIILVGQYMAMKDDAAVSSRSIPCNFSLERLKNLTTDEINAFNTLREAEHNGLSGILNELMLHRAEVKKSLRKNFSDIQNKVMDEMRKQGYRIEARLISNYSIMLAATKSLTDLGIKLPYTFDEFYTNAMDRMVKHNQMLRDNSIVHQFWKGVEVLFDMGLIQAGNQIAISHYPAGINIKEGSAVAKKEVAGPVLLVRFSNVFSAYAKYHRERTGNAPQNEETILNYLKEQTYFIGLTPNETFNDKRTSAYAFNYSAMQELGITLEKNHSERKPETVEPFAPQENEKGYPNDWN
jgi:DNA primase